MPSVGTAVGELDPAVSATVRQRLRWADTGRGTAIALVVLLHASSWVGGSGLADDLWKDASTVLASMRMPLFFVLSGLFAAKWLQADWRSLLRVKVLLFLWVFGVWSVIATLAFPVGLTSEHKPIGVTGLIKGLLLSPVEPRFELWFIWALALFFLVARATRRIPPVVQLSVAAVLSAVGLTLWPELNTGWSGSEKYFFFFLAGLYCRRVVLGFAEKTRPAVLALVFLAWATASVAMFELGLRGLPGVYFLNCLLGVAGGIAVSRGLAGWAALARLGRQTLPVYLAHTPFILGLVFVCSRPPVLAVLSHVPLLVPPVVALAAILLSLGLHRLAYRLRWPALYEPPAWVERLLFEPRRRVAAETAPATAA